MRFFLVPYLTAVLSVSSFMLSATYAQTIPDDARRHMARGQAAMEMAKSPDEYDSAIKEFQEAARLAPTWPDTYYSLGVVQEKAGKFRDAVSSLNRYLQLAPDAPDAVQVKDLIYKIEYKAEQVLTVPDIIDILVSLSDKQTWQVVGNCTKDTIKFKRNAFSSDEYVSTVTASSSSGQWYDSEQLNGPILKYYFNTKKYAGGECAVPSDCCDDVCIIWEVREVEVVSKTLVRVRQKIMRDVPRGRPEAGVVARTLSCTFQKK